MHPKPSKYIHTHSIFKKINKDHTLASSFGMKLLLLTLGLISFVSPAISCSPQFAMVPWCDETTSQPELCKYFFTHDPKYTNPPIKGISDFADASLPLTLDRAIYPRHEKGERLRPQIKV